MGKKTVDFYDIKREKEEDYTSPSKQTHQQQQQTVKRRGPGRPPKTVFEKVGEASNPQDALDMLKDDKELLEISEEQLRIIRLYTGYLWDKILRGDGVTYNELRKAIAEVSLESLATGIHVQSKTLEKFIVHKK